MFWIFNFLTCFDFSIIVNVPFVESGDFMVTLCCLCCSAKACVNVFLTDASSYLPGAVVGFEPRGSRRV